MQVKKGENQQLVLKSGTYDGIEIGLKLVAAAANTAILGSDLFTERISISAVLMRNGQKTTMFNENLLLLGTYNTLYGAYHEFVNGYDKKLPASGVKAIKLRTCKLDFGGHIRVNQGDELIIEVRVSDTVFSTNIDANASYVDFRATKSIGYELYVPKINFQVINANKTSDNLNPGDNIIKMMFLQFDQNTLDSEVITNLGIYSDRWDESFNFDQLMLLNLRNSQKENANRYGSTLPISTSDATGRAFKGLPYLPQSVLLFNGVADSNELDQVSLNVSLNGDNVNSSKNYFVWTSYETTVKTLVEAQNREAKHAEEKIATLPKA